MQLRCSGKQEEDKADRVIWWKA